MDKKNPEAADQPVEPVDEFEFDANAADEIERAIDDSEGHENERGLTNWHVS